MPQFYLAGDWAQSDQAPLICDINTYLAHHLRVRRINDSDSFSIFDGKGHTAKARLLSLSKQSGKIEITHIETDLHRESPYRIELIQGLAGGDKMDWIIEKAVETGVAKIIPVECERSVLRLHSDHKRSEKRLAHWCAIAEAACEQIGGVQDYKNAIGATNAKIKVLLSPNTNDSFERFLHQQAPEDICIAIGPEGGHSPNEEALAQQAGFQILSLGPRTLRTETAGIVAITAVHTVWNLKRA
jgi:16S rRNA (uracil1498-N3)-methyltransferase